MLCAALPTDIAGSPPCLPLAITTASSDANYNALVIPSVTAQITDNDIVGVIVTESGNVTQVTEGGSSDSFTVALNSQPSANVTINVTPDSQLNLGNGPGVPVPLTFTTATWPTAQTITVTAVDDAVAEGTHSGTITFSVASGDATYNGLVVPNVVAQITDNDADP